MAGGERVPRGCLLGGALRSCGLFFLPLRSLHAKVFERWSLVVHSRALAQAVVVGYFQKPGANKATDASMQLQSCICSC